MRGTSLIEVLVALVIFVVGILSVVRMFPGGFLTIKHSENVTQADRLAQAELERWRNRAANLPAAILPWGWDAAAATYTVIPDTDPDDLYESLPGIPYPHYDANRFRRIHAEATKIPVPSSNDWGYGSVYVLAFTPVYWTVNANDGNSIEVYSGPMRRRPIPRSLAYLRIGSYSQYAIDYDDRDGTTEQAVIYLRPASYPRKYVISYSYWRSSGSTQLPELVSVVSDSINVPPGNLSDRYQAVDIPAPGGGAGLLRDTPGFLGIDRGSESLHRGFRDLTLVSNPTWNPDDPYEYMVKWDDRVGYASGVLLFNPYGYGYEEQTARGKEPLTAYIDYTVLDWHIIAEEREVTDGTAKLTLRFLKQIGQSHEYNGQPYPGLSPDLTGPSDPVLPLPYNVVAVDLDTGKTYTDPWTGGGAPPLQVNYKDGIVRFGNDPDTGQPLTGHSFRIHYMAEGDWALQPFKPFEVYRRTPAQPPSYREYFAGNDRIYFSQCYAGCTVALDLTFTANQPQGASVQRTITGDSYQISKEYVTIGGRRLCWIAPFGAAGSMLPERITNQYPAGTTFRIDSVSNVYGVSMGAKVIWRNPGRGFKAGRWKSRELQTCLVRAVE